VREAEVDGDASRFFFWQTVGINSGQRFDQGTLSMIHVTSGSDNKMLRISHWNFFICCP